MKWDWYNGKVIAVTEPGKPVLIKDYQYNGRLKAAADGSLIITNVTQFQNGHYEAFIEGQQSLQCVQDYHLFINGKLLILFKKIYYHYQYFTCTFLLVLNQYSCSVSHVALCIEIPPYTQSVRTEWSLADLAPFTGSLTLQYKTEVESKSILIQLQ